MEKGRTLGQRFFMPAATDQHRFQPIDECSAQTVLLLLDTNLGKTAGSDTSLGMNMDVVELVIYGLLALWGPPLLFAAYLLRPLK